MSGGTSAAGATAAAAATAAGTSATIASMAAALGAGASTAATLASIGSVFGTIASVATPLLSIAGTISASNAQAAQGRAAQQQANYEATQENQNANNAAGSAERAVIAQNKNTALVESNAVGAAAGQGGTSTDPTVETNSAIIATEGNYRAANAMYEGNAKAQAFRNQAAGDIYQGNLTNQAAQTRSQTTLINGASSLFQKYGSSFSSGTPTPYGDLSREQQLALDVQEGD